MIKVILIPPDHVRHIKPVEELGTATPTIMQLARNVNTPKPTCLVNGDHIHLREWSHHELKDGDEVFFLDNIRPRSVEMMMDEELTEIIERRPPPINMPTVPTWAIKAVEKT